MKQVLLVLCLAYSAQLFAFELVAHRGVHQTYHRDGLTMQTCTASRIYEPSHALLENTLDSIEKAFSYRATMVEIDIHPTTEPNGEPDRVAVFHDWELECRTNADCNSCLCDERRKCVTNQQSLSYLKTLDIGHGYTSDDGGSYPFRSQFYGKLPALEEVLDLLLAYEDKKLLVNVKGNVDRSARAFIRIVGNYQVQVRSRLYYPRGERGGGLDAELDALGINESIYQGGEVAKACFKKYILTGMFGHFPMECRGKELFVPIRQTLGIVNEYLDDVKLIDLLWGWPDKFLERAHRHGTKIYPSQVDSVEELAEMKKHPFDGIMTNRIEIIGPTLGSE